MKNLYNILKSIIEKLNTLVRSVNGVKPDKTGNVELELPETLKTPDWNQNDSTAKDYIKNRPGGYFVDGTHTVTLEGGGYEDSNDFKPLAGDVGASFAVTIDGVTEQYTIAYNSEFECKYVGDDPETAWDNPVAGFNLAWNDSSCSLMNMTEDSHTYEFGAAEAAKFESVFMPDSVKPRIEFLNGWYGGTEEDAKNAVAQIPLADNPMSEISATNDVRYSLRTGQLYVYGNFAKYADTASHYYKINSALDTQTISGVFTENANGLIDMEIVDTVDYRAYKVLFFANLPNSSRAVDGRTVRNCVQATAWINGHLFAFSIRDANYGTHFLKGDMEVKKII